MKINIDVDDLLIEKWIKEHMEKVAFSINEIDRELGIGIHKVKRILERLEEFGYVQRTQGRKKNAKYYKLIKDIDPLIESAEKEIKEALRSVRI